MDNMPLLGRINAGRVVVFRALQLGDMLCAVPALRALRQALPAAHITLVGLPWAWQFASRFGNYLDAFVPFPGHPALPEQPADVDSLEAFHANMHARHFSLAIQLHGSGVASNAIVAGFGATHNAGFRAPGSGELPGFDTHPYPATGPEPLRLLALTRWLGAPSQDGTLEFPLGPADWDELAASGLGEGLVPGRYLCVHAGARTSAKRWPPAQFADVADQLAAEFGLATVLTGSAGETGVAAQVASHMKTPARNAAAPISIGAMAALMRGACLLLSNDTGVSHIAAGLGLRSVIIFSNADMDRWAPLDTERHRCIRDPEGTQADLVLAHARSLLAGTSLQ